MNINEFSFSHSRQPLVGQDSSNSATRPSTKGVWKGELDPIDHEKSRMKLKMLLEEQLKGAKGERRKEIQRRLRQIEQRMIRNQPEDSQLNYSEYNKVLNYNLSLEFTSFVRLNVCESSNIKNLLSAKATERA